MQYLLFMKSLATLQIATEHLPAFRELLRFALAFQDWVAQFVSQPFVVQVAFCQNNSYSIKLSHIEIIVK